MIIISCGVNEGKKDYIEYFPNGDVKIKIEMNGDLYHGKAIEYFNNGNVKNIANYINDTLDGEFRVNFKNGNPNVTGIYKSGHYSGELIHYFNNKNIKEVKLYTDSGELWYLSQYDEEGNILYNQILPYFTSSEDTINLGEDYILKVKFNANIRDTTEVVIGYPADHFSFNKVIDTVKFVGDEFIFKYVPKVSGNKRLGFLFKNNLPIKDSTNLNNIFPQHSFYVKE